MSQNQKKKRKEQLGMDYGTACGRLRKMILFKLVCESGRHSCFRCQEEIENVDQFTIEHKIPWQDNDPDLFWDLGNIAFSHARCNVPHRQGGGRHSTRVQNGLWLCMSCLQHLPVDAFSLYSEAKGGTPRNWCKVCRARRKTEGEMI